MKLLTLTLHYSEETLIINPTQISWVKFTTDYTTRPITVLKMSCGTSHEIRESKEEVYKLLKEIDCD